MLSSTMMNCAIPILLTILSADPCATWERTQTAFEDVRKRLWYRHYTMLPIDQVKRWEGSGPTIETILPLVIEEREGRSFQSLFSTNMLAGSYFWGKIIFAKDSPVDPLSHELAHHTALILGEPGWEVIGHGTAHDPYIVALRVKLQFYYGAVWDAGHYYARAALGQVTVGEPDWCVVRE